MFGALRRCSSRALTLSVAPQALRVARSSIASSIPRQNAAIASASVRSLHQTVRWQQNASAQAVEEHPPQEEDEMISTFSQLRDRKLAHPQVVQNITRGMGIDSMTDVQQLTINSALEKADIIAQAKTGTGKTLGFLVPVIQNIINADPTIVARDDPFRNRFSSSPKGRGGEDIRALIISPTRELAEQIAVEAKKVTRGTGIKIQTAVGGTQKRMHLQHMKQEGCHILVGTPGRLKDILSDEYLGISAPSLSALVFDEADRLLDAGFWPEIQEIMRLLPDPEVVERQTMLFSATVPKEVVQLVKDTLKPGFKFIRTVGEDDVPVHERVPQRVAVVRGLENQMPAVYELIKREHTKAQSEGRNFKAIVYFNSTAHVNLANEAFEQLGDYRHHPLGTLRIGQIHSKLSQAGRTRASDDFRRAQNAVLFSSDVTARGMDFPNVTHVIQVGIPKDRDTYIHRVGRTGRAGKEGEGWLIVSQMEEGEFRYILRGIPIQRDNSLVTAKVDMTQGGQVPEEAAEIMTQMTQAHQKVPAEFKSEAYRAFFGAFQWVRRKEELVESMNTLTRVGWGMQSPPSISAALARKLHLPRGIELNIGNDENGGLRRPGDRGSYGGSRGDGFSPREDRGDRGDRSFGGRSSGGRSYGSGYDSRSGGRSGGYGGRGRDSYQREDRGGFRGRDQSFDDAPF